MIIDYLIIIFSFIHFFAILLFLLGLFIKVKVENNTTPFFSVIIALKNEENNIENLIYDLKNQDYPKDKHEILLIDNDSEDQTFAKVRTQTKSLDNFFCYSTKNYQSEFRYKKEALVMGIEKSHGEIILSSDADCTIPKTWIPGFASHYSKNVDMIIGFSEVVANNNIFQKFQKLDFMLLMAAAKGSLNLGFPWGASGQNISFRKKAFYNCDGYNDLKTLKGGDDTLFIQKFAKKNTGKILFASNPDTWVKTKAVESFPDFIRQRIRWASEANYTRNFNILVFFISLATFIANSSLLYYLILSIINGNYLYYFLGLMIIKFLAEFLLAIKASKVFNLNQILPIFPVWFFLYPGYTFFLGLMSFVGHKVKWK